MSRSKKYTQICSNTTSTGQKLFKMKQNRAKRKNVKTRLAIGNYDMPHEKEYGNEWASPRDGKHYLNDVNSKWIRK